MNSAARTRPIPPLSPAAFSGPFIASALVVIGAHLGAKSGIHLFQSYGVSGLVFLVSKLDVREIALPAAMISLMLAIYSLFPAELLLRWISKSASALTQSILAMLGACSGFGVGFWMTGYGFTVLAISAWYTVGCTILYTMLAPYCAEIGNCKPAVHRLVLFLYLGLSCAIICVIGFV